MKIMIVLLIVLAGLAALYLLMIMPRLLGGPDTAPFREWLYAHRGLHNNEPDAAGELAPENSLRAFQKAVEVGFGIEMDVQMTKDHIPVVFHDFTLKRICGGEGKVCEYTYQELQQFSLCGSDQKIPKFEDVLRCVGGKVPLIVELKVEMTDLSVCPAADGLLSEYKGLYCIESFNPLCLFWYRRHRKEVVRGQLAEIFSREANLSAILCFVLQNLLFNWLTKPDFVAYNHNHRDVLSRRICRSLYHNMAVAWTIKSGEQLKAAEKNFDLFIFDSFLPETSRSGEREPERRKAEI